MDLSGLVIVLVLGHLGRASVLERYALGWELGEALPKLLDIPEETVTYEGAQVWKVLGADDKAEYLSYLQERGGAYYLSSPTNSLLSSFLRGLLMPGALTMPASPCHYNLNTR